MSRNQEEKWRIPIDFNQNEVKMIRDKHQMQGLESAVSAAQYRDLAPNHRALSDVLQLFLEEVSGSTDGTNWQQWTKGTPQEQATGVKLEPCTKNINCICIFKTVN